jgi:hypothetical protein
MKIRKCSIRSRVQSEAPRQGVKPPLRSNCWTGVIKVGFRLSLPLPLNLSPAAGK